MDSQTKQPEWLSTYTLITIQRILEKCHINLSQHDLLAIVNKPNFFYQHVLALPLSNVYNGVLLQQAEDYQTFVQKLFIDYLLSGESQQSDESLGASCREDLEEKRIELLSLTESFVNLKKNHYELIASSQRLLMARINELNQFIKQSAETIQHKLNSTVTLNKINEVMLQFFINFNQETDDKAWELMLPLLERQLTSDERVIVTEQYTKFIDFKHDTEHLLANYTDASHSLNKQIITIREQLYYFLIEVKEKMFLLPNCAFLTEKYDQHLGELIFDFKLAESNKKN